MSLVYYAYCFCADIFLIWVVRIMLTDTYLRKHNYLRISITDKCNLRCRYCMPPEGVTFLPHTEVLRNEEFVDLIKIFVNMGVTKVRFTGGEPLLRKGIMDIISSTRQLFPDLELCLTTNGVLLGDYLDRLHEVKLNKLNISLDTLSKKRYEDITRRDSFDQVISNIAQTVESGNFDVKVNAVLFKETLDEIDDFLEYFKDTGVSLRFIERMPFTDEDSIQHFLPSDRLIEVLHTKGVLTRIPEADTRVALMYSLNYKGLYDIKIGIIPPMTHKFCSICNRLRLTSDGKLKTCLYSAEEYDLRMLLRLGTGTQEIMNSIIDSLKKKDEGHRLDCFSKAEGCSSLAGVSCMSKIGG